MSAAVSAALAAIGSLLGCGGLFLLSAVVAVLMQGKPLDVLSTAVSLVLVGVGALVLRAAWRRWRRREP